MNAHCERFIGSIKRECLDRFLIFGENHLRHILSEYLDYYHHRRPHRCREARLPEACTFFRLVSLQKRSGRTLLPAVAHGPPNFDETTRDEVETLELGELVRHEWLGGVLSWYERKAG